MLLDSDPNDRRLPELAVARGDDQAERASLAGHRLDVDMATEEAGQAVRVVQTESGPAMSAGQARVQLRERLEESGPVVLGNADPRVANAHVQLAILPRHGHAHRALI